MRYTRIDVQGDAGKFAIMTRAHGSNTIEIEILAPDGESTLTARADDREDRWAAAKALQAVLDGRPGSGSDIRAYDNAILFLAD